MLFTPEYFKCAHKNLHKVKYANGLYKCDKCNQEFTLIPVKNEPITMPLIPPHEKPPRPRPDNYYN